MVGSQEKGITQSIYFAVYAHDLFSATTTQERLGKAKTSLDQMFAGGEMPCVVRIQGYLHESNGYPTQPTRAPLTDQEFELFLSPEKLVSRYHQKLLGKDYLETAEKIRSATKPVEFVDPRHIEAFKNDLLTALQKGLTGVQESTRTLERVIKDFEARLAFVSLP